MGGGLRLQLFNKKSYVSSFLFRPNLSSNKKKLKEKKNNTNLKWVIFKKMTEIYYISRTATNVSESN